MVKNGSEVFAELAGQLRELASRRGYAEHRLHLGPLSLSLFIAPECADLGFPTAFADETAAMNDSGRAPSCASSCASSGAQDDTLTIFIMRLPNPAIEGSLRHVLNTPTKTLQQLSNRQHTEQFVINDGERKTLRVFDQVNRIGLLAFTDATLLPPWEFFSPVKEFIHLHALNQSCLLFHGATVLPVDVTRAAVTKLATNGIASQTAHATLLVGPGGSGKSTLTAYAIEQGMLTTGDDYVLIDLRDDTPVCHAVYRTLKLHPTSPVLEGHHGWQAWRRDSLTGKSVMLANSVKKGGPLISETAISSVVGLSLQPSSAVFNPKAQSILSDPSRHPYLHSSMSTIQQMPYRIDTTLQLSRKLHQAVPYRALAVASGMAGLEQALAMIKESVV